jgi:hypothetical protein
MINIIAIVVASITAAGSCGYGACRYHQHVYDPAADDRPIPPARPNTPVPNYKIEHTLDEEVMEHVKGIVMEKMKKRDSDTDTEIDIKINIHSHHEDDKNYKN